MRKLLILIFSLIALTPVNSQKKEGRYHSREVIIQVGDTLIRADILTGELTGKPVPGKEYFWYWKGLINSNIGGYAGKLFNGDYLAFLNNKLVESGQFNKGLKSGMWKTWYSTGRIQKICTWEEGKLYGKYCYYSENGIVERRGIYKNDKFHSILERSIKNSPDKTPPPLKNVHTKKKHNEEGSSKNPKKRAN